MPFVMGNRFRRGVAAAIVGAGLVAGCGDERTGIGLDLVSEGQVEDMGLQAWQAIRAETAVSDNADYQRRADRVADQVLAAAGRNPAAWDVVVFEGDEPNAFALPGQKIGIYEGMMRLTGSDAELAAVIAHEVAHLEADHAQQRVNSEVATQLGIDLASAVLGGGEGSGQALAQLLGAGVQYGVILPYSRNQELEADRLGLRYMAQAGYDPRAALDFWARMRDVGPRPPTFLSTHPAPGQRIDQLQALMPEAVEIYETSG